jgi:predicted PurR-regulated permease PerM
MPGWRIVLWAVLVLAAALFLYLVRGILLPFILSFIIAALLEPTVRKLRLRGMSRALAVGVVVGAFFVLATASLVLVTPTLVRQAGNLRVQLSNVMEAWTQEDPSQNFFVRWRAPILAEEPMRQAPLDRILGPYRDTLERFGVPATQRTVMEQYIEPQRPRIADAVQNGILSFFGLFSGIFSHILLIVLIPILVPLILMEYDEYRKRGPRWIPPAIRATAVSVMSDIGQVFFKYLRGIAFVVFLYTVAMTTLMLLLGVPYALILGPIFGALYLIPYIGNVISAATLFLVVGFGNVTGTWLFQLPSPWVYAMIATTAYLAVGWIFDHMIYPQMVGNSVGLSPVISMFVILCGGALFGLPGMIIAFPLAGSVKVILDRLIRITSTSTEGLGLPAVPLRHRTTASG